MYIQDQLQEIKANIAAAEQRAGREPGSVKLLAVSKTFPVEDIMQAYDDGQRLFGENRLQEAMSKMPEMPADCEWHPCAWRKRWPASRVSWAALSASCWR